MQPMCCWISGRYLSYDWMQTSSYHEQPLWPAVIQMGKESMAIVLAVVSFLPGSWYQLYLRDEILPRLSHGQLVD